MTLLLLFRGGEGGEEPPVVAKKAGGRNPFAIDSKKKRKPRWIHPHTRQIFTHTNKTIGKVIVRYEDQLAKAKILIHQDDMIRSKLKLITHRTITAKLSPLDRNKTLSKIQQTDIMESRSKISQPLSNKIIGKLSVGIDVLVRSKLFKKESHKISSDIDTITPIYNLNKILAYFNLVESLDDKEE